MSRHAFANFIMGFLYRVFLMAFVFLTTFRACSQGAVEVDFSARTGYASNLMFGGNNYGFSTRAISDAHRKAGFNVARYDALINEIVPAATIDNYKDNVNNVCDPSHWNWTRIDTDLNMLCSSGFRVLLIIDYCPLWLTCLQSRQGNTINAVPVDWAVYEDIVAKLIAHVRTRIFELEVWNEPDVSLNISGSPYHSRMAAYLEIYYHTARAIRQVEKSIWIGGPAIANTYDTTFFKAMLADKRLSGNFNFYSYHFYGFQKAGNITMLKRVAAESGRRSFPIVISEWNYSANFDNNPMNSNAPEAIPFVANTLINQLKEQPYMSVMYCMDDYKKADNFFTMDINGLMVPKVAVTTLLSVKLGLGSGNNSVFKTKVTGGINAIGVVNSAGKMVICITNAGNVDKAITVDINNAHVNGPGKIELFCVSPGSYNDLSPLTLTVPFSNGNATILKRLMPANSVMGVLIL